MNPTTRQRGLLVLNGALLLTLGALVLSPPTFAQRGGRARGEYTMVSGKIIGGNSHAVYILDGANQEVLAAKWNDSAKSVDIVSYRDMQADIQAQPGR